MAENFLEPSCITEHAPGLQCSPSKLARPKGCLEELDGCTRYPYQIQEIRTTATPGNPKRRATVFICISMENFVVSIYADSEELPHETVHSKNMAIFKLKGQKAGKGTLPQNERIDSTIGTGVLLTATTTELAVGIGIRAVLCIMHELIPLMCRQSELHRSLSSYRRSREY